MEQPVVLNNSVLTVADRVTAMAFSVKHPMSSFADSSVALFCASGAGVSSYLCELGGAAPRMSQLSFAAFGSGVGEAISLQVVENVGVAVGHSDGRVSLLSNAGAYVSERQIGVGPVEALCSLNGLAVLCSCDDGLMQSDGTRVAALGWTPAALAALDTSSVCCVGRGVAIHDVRAQKSSLISPNLRAPGVAAAVGEARQLLLGLANGEAVAIDLRRAEAPVLVAKHGRGQVYVALEGREREREKLIMKKTDVEKGALRWSGGSDGVIAKDGNKCAQTGSAIVTLAAEPRLHAIAASTSMGRIWLAAQK